MSSVGVPAVLFRGAQSGCIHFASCRWMCLSSCCLWVSREQCFKQTAISEHLQTKTMKSFRVGMSMSLERNVDYSWYRRNLRVNWYMPAHSWKVQQGIEHTMLHQSPRHDPNSGIQLGRALLEARAHDKKPGMKAFPKEDVEMTLKSAQNELLLQEMDSAKSFKAFLMKERGHVPHFLEMCQGPSSPDPTSPRHKTSTCSTPRLPDVVAAGQQSPRPSMNATPRRGIEAS